MCLRIITYNKVAVKNAVNFTVTDLSVILTSSYTTVRPAVSVGEI